MEFFTVIDMMSHSCRLRPAQFHIVYSADSLLTSERNSQEEKEHVDFCFQGYEAV
jgi:hypothetical protein